jgi:hypothetical protein
MTKLKIKEQDLKDWFNIINRCKVNDGWEFVKVFNDDYFAVKIRKPYSKDEIAFNDDGYKYETLYVNFEKTKDYLFFTQRGYVINIVIF